MKPLKKWAVVYKDNTIYSTHDLRSFAVAMMREHELCCGTKSLKVIRVIITEATKKKGK